MATTINTLPKLITSADANNEEVTIDDPIFNDFPYPIITIEVVTGTFNFAVGQPASDSDAEYGAGDSLVVTLRTLKSGKNPLKLNYKAANASETFKVSH